MEPFNFEYICAETIRNITISFNSINIFGLILLLIFVTTAIWRKVNWIITVLVALMLLAGLYFVTLNIQYEMGCASSLVYQTEWIPSWWAGQF